MRFVGIPQIGVCFCIVSFWRWRHPAVEPSIPANFYLYDGRSLRGNPSNLRSVYRIRFASLFLEIE